MTVNNESSENMTITEVSQSDLETAAAVFNESARTAPLTSEPIRDDSDKYRVLKPNPEARGYALYQRVSHIKDAMFDNTTLYRWAERYLAEGLIANPDLQERWLAEGFNGETFILNKIIKAAKERAGIATKANLGVAIHRLAEKLNTGADLGSISPVMLPKLEAYLRVMTMEGWQIYDGHVERCVLNDDYRYAGQIDAAFRTKDGIVLADYKTGPLKYDRLGIAVQLAMYANHTATIDYTRPLLDAAQWRTRPAVDEMQSIAGRGDRLEFNTDYAFVVHLPSLPGDDRCEIHKVPLGDAWEKVERFIELRAQSRRLKKWQLMTSSTQFSKFEVS